MKEDKLVNDYFTRTLSIVNNMKIHGEMVAEHTVVEKIVRFMSSKFNYVVCAIEELFIDEL